MHLRTAGLKVSLSVQAPTGLVLGFWLTRLRVRVRVIDNTSEPGTVSRARIQALTLELYNQIGLAEPVVDRGRKIIAAYLWVKGERSASAVFREFDAGTSPFGYALVFPPNGHERVLIDCLAETGVQVERRTELLNFAMSLDRVVASRRCANCVLRESRQKVLYGVPKCKGWSEAECSFSSCDQIAELRSPIEQAIRQR